MEQQQNQNSHASAQSRAEGANLIDVFGVLKHKWYVVCPPWGDGTWIRAGAEDANGKLVVDCKAMLDPNDVDFVPDEAAAAIAEHIVRLHNASLSMPNEAELSGIAAGRRHDHAE